MTLLPPTAVAQEDSEPATVVPPYSPATTQAARQPLSPEQRAQMLALSVVRQRDAMRRNYVELQEQIAPALARRWGSLPAHVGVETDTVGRPWFLPYQAVPHLRRPHDGLFLEAVESATGRPWVLLGDVEPIWSDAQRVWGVLEHYPHLLHSGDADTGDWEMLLPEGSVLRGHDDLEEHLLSHREPRFRDLPPHVRPPLPADANLGRWLPAVAGRDGTLHLFAHDPAEGLVVRSGKVDAQRGASQVADWPLIVLEADFAPQQQGRPGQPRADIEHARLPDGSVWVRSGPDAEQMWHFTPGEKGGWEAIASPEPHASMGTADTVLPLPSMGTGEMILFNRVGGQLVQRSVPLEIDVEQQRHLDVLVADLDDPDYEVRERATRELSRQPEAIIGYLRERLEASVSPEQRNRLLSVLVRLENRNQGINRLLVGEERIDFRRAHLIADGRHGRGAVLLLEDPHRAPREAADPEEAAVQRGRARGEDNPPLLLFIDYRPEAPAPRVRLESVAAEQASLNVQGPGQRSGAWIREDFVWRGDGHAFEREDGAWHLRDRRPDETPYLLLRTVDREGRVYFDTTWGDPSETPLLIYNADAPVIVDSPPDDALAFAEFPGLGGLEPVPPAVDGDAGSLTTEGGWGRLGNTVGKERLVRPHQREMEEMPLVPEDEEGRRPQLAGIVPLRGGAVVLSSTYAEAPATFWDGQKWHIAPTVEGLIYEHAPALAARAGANPRLEGLDSRGKHGVGLASDGRGGLWFIQHQQRNGAGDEKILRVEHFDGAEWRDALSVVETAGGGSHPVFGQVPTAMTTAEAGRLLIVRAYLTPDEPVDRRTGSSVKEALFGVRLEEDNTLSAQQLGAPGSGSDLEVLADAQGRLWSRAFGPESHILGVWINGENLPRTRDEVPRIRERFTAVPPVRPPYRRQSNKPVEQQRVSLLSGRLQLLDRGGRLWLIAGHVGNPGDAHPRVYVRLPASSSAPTTGPTPTTGPATQPTTLPADQDEDRPENVDVLGGEWLMYRVEQMEGDATGGFHLLPLADGSVWLVSGEGIGRLEIIRKEDEREPRELQLSDFRPWPQPLERIVAAFPDGNGFWIDPGHNRFRKRLPTRYVEILPAPARPAALDAGTLRSLLRLRSRQGDCP